MARKTPGSVKVSAVVIQELNAGRRETANLAECLAVDCALLMQNTFPEMSAQIVSQLTDGKPSITQRMLLGGQILLEHLGPDDLTVAMEHPSDTVRGWAAYAIGLTPDLTLAERLERIRPLADDPHFGVREWAWMALRTHVAADLEDAFRLLQPWTAESSPFLRRYAVELTRPRGVWTAHIDQLKKKPQMGLPLLKPLRADPEKYVQDSVSNWLNDAAKSQPDWVRELCESWADDCQDKATLRICRRAIRSLRGEEDSE